MKKTTNKDDGTILAPDIVFKGTLKATSEICIAGTFNGTLNAESNVLLKGATIDATIEAATIHSNNSSIKGSITAYQELVCTQDTQIEGKLTIRNLVTEPSVIINGTIHMSPAPSRGEKAPPLTAVEKNS